MALAEFGMQHGGGAGGATIMDLPSGALSLGEQFIDLHQVMTDMMACKMGASLCSSLAQLR